MMKNYTMVVFLVLTGLIATGCASLGPEGLVEKSIFGGGRVTGASANQIFDADFEGFDDEKLFRLLDPENKACQNKNKSFSELGTSEKIECLRKAFREANSKEYGVSHRSQIQDRLIAASNQRCNLYTTYLKRLSTYYNGIFGTLTTILGGAGAIVTGANSARILSGLAGISSGTRAELNQAIFESIATSVIIPGIQKSRNEFHEDILKKRKNTLEEYTIEGAIADAITYHGYCSMDTGIAYAQKSIQSYDDIGIKRFIELQRKFGLARSASESFTIGPLASLVVAGKVLEDFEKQLNEDKIRINKLDLSKDKQKDVKIKYDALLKATSDKEGDLCEEAQVLDDELKTAISNFASATGVNKSDSFSVLELQQIKARNYAKKIEAKNTEFRIELRNFVP